MTALFVLLPALLAAMFFRLAYVQFFHPHDLEKRAERQSSLIVKLPPYRGKIYDRSGRELALDIQLDSLGAHSKHIRDPQALAQKLHVILGIDTAVLREKLTRKKEFVWIARLITPEQSEKIKKLGRKDLELRKEWKRIYPNRQTASQIVGFTGLDHQGLEGLEMYFDSYLRGVPGWKLTQKDAKQREIVARETDLVLPVDGYDLHLTVDVVIQHIAEKHLNEACEKYNAIGGNIVVMDPGTGDVLALANYPSYDPNNLKTVKQERVRNRAITDIYEPGSIFKIFTLSAVLQEKAMTLKDRLFCENGNWRVGGRILHDVHPYGSLTLEEVLAKSSNIGTVKAAYKIGAAKLNDYIKRFGFGARTDILLKGESPGLVTNPKNYSATSMSSVPIGQEVGITAIQLACAVSAIAADGMLPKPRLVSSVRDASGQVIRSFEPEARRRAIDAETARQVRQAMGRVVQEGGTGKLGNVPGAEVGGKTGTSQKLDANGRYSHSDFIGSFVGYVRKGGRTVVITVSIDNPKPVYYGGVVAAPVFSKVAKGILEYWQLGTPADEAKAKPKNPARPAIKNGRTAPKAVAAPKPQPRAVGTAQ